MKNFLLDFLGIPHRHKTPLRQNHPPEPYVTPPPKGRIPFIGFIDLAEINTKLNHIPTEDGFEMIPQGFTADCGDEAYVESYDDTSSYNNLIGWYPIPEGTKEKWRVVGGPCMRMARRKKL